MKKNSWGTTYKRKHWILHFIILWGGINLCGLGLVNADDNATTIPSLERDHELTTHLTNGDDSNTSSTAESVTETSASSTDQPETEQPEETTPEEEGTEEELLLLTGLITSSGLNIEIIPGLPDVDEETNEDLDMNAIREGAMGHNVLQVNASIQPVENEPNYIRLRFTLANLDAQKPIRNLRFAVNENFFNYFYIESILPEPYSRTGTPLPNNYRRIRLIPTIGIEPRTNQDSLPNIEMEICLRYLEQLEQLESAQFTFIIAANYGYTKQVTPHFYQLKIRNDKYAADNVLLDPTTSFQEPVQERITDCSTITSDIQLQNPRKTTYLTTYDSYVTINENSFQLGDENFRFIGVNLPYLLELSKRAIDETLLVCALNHITVLRVWAGIEYPAYKALQPGPNQYNPAQLEKLDYIVYKAKQMGLRIILVLSDFTGRYGGPYQYLRWGYGHTNYDSILDFYTHESSKSLYKNFIQGIGERYQSMNAVIGYDLLNNAIGKDGSKGSLDFDEHISGWIREMATALKEAAPNQLIGLGDQGYFFLDQNVFQDQEFLYVNEYNGYYNIHWEALASIEALDYLTFDLMPNTLQFNTIEAYQNWLQRHLQSNVNKPILLTNLYTSFYGRYESIRNILRDPNSTLDGIIFSTIAIDKLAPFYNQLDEYVPLENHYFFYGLIDLANRWAQPPMPTDY